MGKTRKTYDLHLNDRMGYQTAEAVQEAVCKYIHFYQPSTVPKEVKQPEPISIQDSGCFVSF
ncbi:hypothetical protein P9D26_07290 [Bacillus velezensis]|uniref:hypothetical protein n=1 Tax=Bacillus velezensis TaxID=492670 RepID=UPI002DB86D48|nr:hypothetical protein [Bacillus velezensis]MBZ5517380.1 hypothetical protein [Bacillus sp. KS1]MEC1393149.1 hypothetical protein [Bacillus velezensis]